MFAYGIRITLLYAIVPMPDGHLHPKTCVNWVPYLLTRMSIPYGNVSLGYSIQVSIFVREAKKSPRCWVFTAIFVISAGQNQSTTGVTIFGTVKNSTQENKRVSCLFDWFDTD